MKSICAIFFALLATAAATARVDTAMEWNQRAMAAITTAKQSLSEAAKTMVAVQAAMSGAVNALGQGNGSNTGAHSVESSRSAASAIAAFAILEHLFPDQLPELEVWLAVSLADIPESQAKADALVVGRKAANEILGRGAQ